MVLRIPSWFPARNRMAKIILMMKENAINITRYLMYFLQETLELNNNPTIRKKKIIASIAIQPTNPGYASCGNFRASLLFFTVSQWAALVVQSYETNACKE